MALIHPFGLPEGCLPGYGHFGFLKQSVMWVDLGRTDPHCQIHVIENKRTTGIEWSPLSWKSTANHFPVPFFFLLYNLCTRTNCALVAQSLAAYILPTGTPMIRVAAESILLDKYKLRCAVAAERGVLQPFLGLSWLYSALFRFAVPLLPSWLRSRLWSVPFCYTLTYSAAEAVFWADLSFQTGGCFSLHANLLISFTYCIQHFWSEC